MKFKLFTIFFLLIILVGCTQNIETTKRDDFLFTDEEVINVLRNNGIILNEDKDMEAELFKLYYITPSKFTLENNEKLLVYTFDDFKGREIAQHELDIRRGEIIGLFGNDAEFYRTLEAKNALLVYSVSKKNTTGWDIYERLESIVFEELNEGTENLYTGRGEYWEGEILVKSYFHWWEDEKGNLIDSDSKGYETGYLHYKGNIEDVVTEIDFKVIGGGGGTEARGYRLDKNGYIDLGRGGSSNSSSNSDAIYTVTINWNDKEEIIELTSKEHR